MNDVQYFCCHTSTTFQKSRRQIELLRSCHIHLTMCYHIIRYTTCSVCSSSMNKYIRRPRFSRCRRGSIRACALQNSYPVEDRVGVCNSAECLHKHERTLEIIRNKIARLELKLTEEFERRLPDIYEEGGMDELDGMAGARRERGVEEERLWRQFINLARRAVA